MSAIDQSSQPTQSSYFKNAIRIGGAIAGVAACGLGLAALWCSASETNTPNNLCGRGSTNSTSVVVNTAFQGLQVVAAAAVSVFQGMGVVGNLAAGAHVDREQEHLQMNQLKLEEFQNCYGALFKLSRSQSECAVPAQNRTRPPLAADRGLASNLRLGEEILFETGKDVRFSVNNMPRSKRLIEEQARKQGASPDVAAAFSDVKHDFCFLVERAVASDEAEQEGGGVFAYMKSAAKYAVGTHIGNCGEMAAVAFFKALEKGMWNVPVDIVYITNGDHAFLVIGREPDSDPENYKTWGPSAVVVDAWSKKVYKVSDLEANLEDYFGLDETTGEPKLRPFDPKTQGLAVVLSSGTSIRELNYFIYSGIGMSDGQKEAVLDLRRCMQRFHKSNDLETKLEIAKEVSKLVREPGIADFPIVQQLRDQIDHFIEQNNQ